MKMKLIISFFLTMNFTQLFSMQKDPRQALFYQIVRGNVTELQKTLASLPRNILPSIKFGPKSDCSPINLAVIHKQNRVLSLFLKEYKDVFDMNFPDCNGHTPLHNAVILSQNESDYNITYNLLLNGANPNIPDNILRTPLHYAVEKKIAKIVLALADFNAIMELRDSDGNTPLLLSVPQKLSYKEALDKKSLLELLTISTILLDSGANPFTKNANNQKPLELAQNIDCEYFIKLFLIYEQKVTQNNTLFAVDPKTFLGLQ